MAITIFYFAIVFIIAILKQSLFTQFTIVSIKTLINHYMHLSAI